MSADCQDLLGFTRAAIADPNQTTSLEALVEDLERTFPDLSGANPSSQTTKFPLDPSRASRGIMGLISRVSSLERKEQFIEGASEQTDALTNSLLNVRTTLTDPLRKQFSTLSLDAKSVDFLQQQQSRLSDLVAKAQAISPAMVALVKQQQLLNVFTPPRVAF